MSRVLAVLALFVWTSVVVSACDNGALPSGQSPVRFTARIDTPVVPTGGTAVLTFRVENHTSERLVLRFPSACQILPFIRESQTNRTVHPDAGWACAQVLSTLELEPGASASRDVVVESGVSIASSTVPLGPGDYVADAMLGESAVEAEFGGRSVMLTGEQRRSTPVTFTVR